MTRLWRVDIRPDTRTEGWEYHSLIQAHDYFRALDIMQMTDYPRGHYKLTPLATESSDE
jgi:hypothetical protein